MLKVHPFNVLCHCLQDVALFHLLDMSDSKQNTGSNSSEPFIQMAQITQLKTIWGNGYRQEHPHKQKWEPFQQIKKAIENSGVARILDSQTGMAQRSVSRKVLKRGSEQWWRHKRQNNVGLVYQTWYTGEEVKRKIWDWSQSPPCSARSETELEITLNTLNEKPMYIVMTQRNITTIAEVLCIKATVTSRNSRNMKDVVLGDDGKLIAPEWVPSLRGIQPREAS